MVQSSRNFCFQPSQSNRRVQAIFASANRYFTENSRLLTQSQLFLCPLIAFNARKTHLGMYIFSNFTMFVKQILKDSPINFKHCNSSYFLSYSPVREFIASKVRLSSLFGCSHCSKSLRTIADHLMHRYEAKISDSKRKKPDSQDLKKAGKFVTCEHFSARVDRRK